MRNWEQINNENKIQTFKNSLKNKTNNNNQIKLTLSHFPKNELLYPWPGLPNQIEPQTQNVAKIIKQPQIVTPTGPDVDKPTLPIISSNQDADPDHQSDIQQNKAKLAEWYNNAVIRAGDGVAKDSHSNLVKLKVNLQFVSIIVPETAWRKHKDLGPTA